VSGKVRISGQPRQLFEPLKNNVLFCCPANPFLDTWFRLMDRTVPQAISVGIYNHLLFIDIDAFREKTHVLRTYPEYGPGAAASHCCPRPGDRLCSAVMLSRPLQSPSSIPLHICGVNSTVSGKSHFAQATMRHRRGRSSKAIHGVMLILQDLEALTRSASIRTGVNEMMTRFATAVPPGETRWHGFCLYR
jgi:hypothetical protein